MLTGYQDVATLCRQSRLAAAGLSGIRPWTSRGQRSAHAGNARFSVALAPWLSQPGRRARQSEPHPRELEVAQPRRGRLEPGDRRAALHQPSHRAEPRTADHTKSAASKLEAVAVATRSGSSGSSRLTDRQGEGAHAPHPAALDPDPTAAALDDPLEVARRPGALRRARLHPLEGLEDALDRDAPTPIPLSATENSHALSDHAAEISTRGASPSQNLRAFESKFWNT